jgi:hypothetical protein
MGQFVAYETEDSAPQIYSVSALYAYSALTITAPANYQLSLNGTTWAGTLRIAPVDEAIAETTIYVKLEQGTQGDYDGVITHTMVGASESLAVDGIIWPDIEYSGFYLPSKDELNKIYVNLYSESLGDLLAKDYWSSTEAGGSGAVYQDFADGTQADNQLNTVVKKIRPLRHFEMNTSDKEFSIGDLMPSGGYISDKVDLGDDDYRYYEAATEDLTPAAWCNLTSVSYNEAGVGYGLANSEGIILKVGHTNSAAKDCLDYEP